MEQEDLKATLESLLFVSNRPLGISDFQKVLELQPEVLQAALDEMVQKKKQDGIVLLESDGQYQLATNSKYSTAVKNFLNAELREKLTDATVEVLAIITYRQPISKAEIEAIRGVNSQYSIRNLLMRGLIEKIPNPSDARSFLYQTTTEFLQHLGLTSTKDLPEFEKLVEQIKLPQTPPMQMEQQQTAQGSAEPEEPSQSAAPDAQPQPEATAAEVTEEAIVVQEQAPTPQEPAVTEQQENEKTEIPENEGEETDDEDEYDDDEE